MDDHVLGMGAGMDLGSGTNSRGIAEQLRALHEQRRLVDALLEDISRTRSRLNVEPGAGAAWQSAAQRTYMVRRLDLRNQFGLIVWRLEGARESLNDVIVRVVRG